MFLAPKLTNRDSTQSWWKTQTLVTPPPYSLSSESFLTLAGFSSFLSDQQEPPSFLSNPSLSLMFHFSFSGATHLCFMTPVFTGKKRTTGKITLRKCYQNHRSAVAGQRCSNPEKTQRHILHKIIVPGNDEVMVGHSKHRKRVGATSLVF